MTNISPLRSGEHELIGNIIGESFFDDPVNSFLLGCEASIRTFNIKMARKVYLKKGFGHVAEDHSGGTMWLPPGVTDDLPLWQSLGLAATLIKHQGVRGALTAVKAGEEMARHRPNQPFFYLYAIGNTPAGKGKGAGAKLMEAGLKIVDEAGMPAFLESSKEVNVAFYQRYGFALIGKSVLVPGCPPEWLMLRPAQTKSV